MSDGLEFKYSKLNSKSCAIIGINSDSTIINIPKTSPDGLEITKIADSAFKNNKVIEEVIFCDSVNYIGDSSFEGCSNLCKVKFPSKIKEIGKHAFKRCNLSIIEIPEVKFIDFAAFSKNTNATVYINEKIDMIRGFAFNECNSVICSIHPLFQKDWDPEWKNGAQSIKFVDEPIFPHYDDPLLLEKNIENSEENTKEETDSLNEINDNTQKIIISNNEDKNSSGIYYTKSKKISFPVTGLVFTDIPVLKSVQLSFYEKYVVLILQKGINASIFDELVSKISTLLNVSSRCIKEFLEYLKYNDYLNFDYKNQLYKLDDSIHFVLDEKYDNAMFAEFDVKKADCNNIVLVNNLNMFYLDEDFAPEVFRRKGSANNKTDKSLSYSTINFIENSSDLLEPLFVRSFSKTNMHLKKDFDYELVEDNYLDFQFEFEALVEYKYFKETKQSVRQNVVVLKDNFLPEAFINSLASSIDLDDKIPRFIELDESFYQKIDPNINILNDLEESIDIAQNAISPIEEELNVEKEKLSSLKKEHTKTKKKEQDKSIKIKKEIELKEDEIKTNEMLIDSSDDSNSELIRNLKNTIKELKREKTVLEKELDDYQKEIDNLTKTFKETEDELNSTIKAKEDEIKRHDKSIKDYEQKQKDIVKEYNGLVLSNGKKIHPIIKSVIEKYPADKNILYRYINDICLWLDYAISASEYNSFDELGRCIDTIREMYRKVLQAVFDVVLQKNVQNLGSYFSDVYNIIAIEDMFRKRKVQIDVKNKLIIFHALANAIGHSIENGPKKRENEQRVDEFKKLKVLDREKILLAIPNMFLAIEFSKNETKSIVLKLKV